MYLFFLSSNNEAGFDFYSDGSEVFLFDDVFRNAISIGGDSDTIAAMTSAVAEAYYGVPEEIKTKALSYLDNYLFEEMSKIKYTR